MQTRRLGRSGLEVGAIGLGCWAIGGPFWRTDGVSREPMGWSAVDDGESIRAIRRALDLGVTLFDTANNYGAGHSERILGRALGDRRDEVVVVTKFGSVFDEDEKLHYDNRTLELTRPVIEAELDASLRRLGTDRIDVYLLHDGQLDPAAAAELVPILEELVATGKIRWYGWSTDDAERARIFASGEHCTAIEHRLSMSFDAPEVLEVVERHDLASIVKQPLNSGVLTGKFTAETRFPADDGRRDIDFTQGLGAQRLQQIEALRDRVAGERRTLAQAALAWVLTRSGRTVPIPGFKTVAQVEDLAGAADRSPLDPDEVDAVREVFAL